MSGKQNRALTAVRSLERAHGQRPTRGTLEAEIERLTATNAELLDALIRFAANKVKNDPELQAHIAKLTGASQ